MLQGHQLMTRVLDCGQKHVGYTTPGIIQSPSCFWGVIRLVHYMCLEQLWLWRFAEFTFQTFAYARTDQKRLSSIEITSLYVAVGNPRCRPNKLGLESLIWILVSKKKHRRDKPELPLTNYICLEDDWGWSSTWTVDEQIMNLGETNCLMWRITFYGASYLKHIK